MFRSTHPSIIPASSAPPHIPSEICVPKLTYTSLHLPRPHPRPPTLTLCQVRALPKHVNKIEKKDLYFVRTGKGVMEGELQATQPPACTICLHLHLKHGASPLPQLPSALAGWLGICPVQYC